MTRPEDWGTFPQYYTADLENPNSDLENPTLAQENPTLDLENPTWRTWKTPLPKTFTLAAGKCQNMNPGGFLAATRNPPGFIFWHFPAARGKVLNVRKVFRARNTLRTLKTFTLAAGKWQKYDRGISVTRHENLSPWPFDL